MEEPGGGVGVEQPGGGGGTVRGGGEGGPKATDRRGGRGELSSPAVLTWRRHRAEVVGVERPD
jgi:hypothetical protein